jgi:hypothetical protein
MRSKLVKFLGVAAVVAMLATALVVPVAAMASPKLEVGSTTVGATTSYTVTFTLGAAQPAATAGIVVNFGSGIIVGTPTVSIQISPGSGSTTMATTVITADTTIAGQTATINTSNGTVPIGAITSGSIIALTFSNMANPAAVGNYTVTVATAVETPAVASNAITTTAAVTTAAAVYNAAGTLVTSSPDLAAALLAVQSQNLTGATIKVAAGTYKSAYPASTTVPCTIQGIDAAAANVILQSTGAWALTGAAVTVDKVTIDASSGGLLTMGGASTTAASVTNSSLKGGVLTMAAAGTNATNTISNDNFVVLTGATGLSAKAATTVTGSTFTTAGTGVGITATANVNVSGATFTGTSAAGFGITLTGGAASVISANTFTGLTTALTVGDAGAGVSFNGNTVTSCGILSKNDAITVTATSGTNVINNNISKSLNNIISVSGNDALVNVMLNSFSSNASSAVDTAGSVLNCTRNYWGGKASNPNSTASVSYASPLGAAPVAASYATGATGMMLTANKTVGVNITASANITAFGASAFDVNPVSQALPSSATLLRYFDVFGVANPTTATATIDFYGTTANPVTANSTVYYYNAGAGTWFAASNVTVNTAGNFVEIKIAPAGTGAATAPAPSLFDDLPFALVNVGTTKTTTTTTAATTGVTTTTATGATTPATSSTTATKTTVTTTGSTTTTAATTAATTTPTTTGSVTTPGEKPVLPSTMLYVFIGVGAILVVALVVLVIRSRKP